MDGGGVGRPERRGAGVRGATISETILSRSAGTDARAGDIVVCEVDAALGTDASTPMALDYFRRMEGREVRRPERIAFFRDHYAPPASADTAAHHDRMRAFAAEHGIAFHRVGDGISHQVACEEGMALPGRLVVGADSHTVMCGALGCFATGIGSSDLAAVMITGQVWLRVPSTIWVTLEGALPPGALPKDAVLTLLREVGESGAAYRAMEFHGPGVETLDMEGRLVLANMTMEMGAKAGIFPADGTTADYLEGRAGEAWEPVAPAPDAAYEREVTLDLSGVRPLISLPHRPGRVVPVDEAAGTQVDMVFVGTCTGGRASDVREVLRVLEAAGGIDPGVQLAVTPASREVQRALLEDGTLERLSAMGALLTTPGCGPCCGTSGPIPGDGMNVVAAQNRNFRARMGNATASIYLASPAVCGAAAATGEIVDPASVLEGEPTGEGG